MANTLNNHALLTKKCQAKTPALSTSEIKEYLHAVDGWALANGKINKSFTFRNYYQTLAFVNAIAFVFHTEDHHPELIVNYSDCQVKFDTHSVNQGAGGLSENDFICAAKVDAIAEHAFG